MKRIIIGLMALALLAGAVTAANADEDSFDPIEALAAEEALEFGGVTAADLLKAGLSGPEVAAAQRRVAFGHRHADPHALYESRVGGAENFGGLRLEDDGTLTVRYVNDRPELANMPDNGQMPIRFEQVELPFNDSMAERDANPTSTLEEIRAGEQSNPDQVHNYPYAGIEVGVACEQPRDGSGVSPSTMTATGIVKHDNGANNVVKYSMLTAGHGLTNDTSKPGDNGCPDKVPGLKYTYDMITDDGVYIWSDAGGHPISGAGDIIPGIWQNTEADLDGRKAFLLYGNYHNNEWMDAGLVRIKTSDVNLDEPITGKDGAKFVHMWPRHEILPEFDIPNHWTDPEKFRQVDERTNLVENEMLCIAQGTEGNDDGFSPFGVTCHKMLGYDGNNLYHLSTSGTYLTNQGDSGSPVVQGSGVTNNPDHVGMVQGQTCSILHGCRIQFFRTTDVLGAMNSNFPAYQPFRLCSQKTTGGFSVTC